jgi:putative transport protein
MQELLHWLASNAHLLLFMVVLCALLLARVNVRGRCIDAATCAIVVGMGTSAFFVALGFAVEIDDLLRSVFYFAFMYTLGFRIGPSILDGVRGEGLQFALLAGVCTSLASVIVVFLAKAWEFPPGVASGIIAGSMTMAAALGTADVGGTTALAFCLAYLCGVAGILVAFNYLPDAWGADVKADAKKWEEDSGVANMDAAGLTAYRPLAVRAYRLQNESLTGWTVKQFMQKYRHAKVLNVLRGEPARRSTVGQAAVAFAGDDGMVAVAGGGAPHITRLLERDTTPLGKAKAGEAALSETVYAKLGANDALAFRQGDIITIGGHLDHVAQNIALIGPQIADENAHNVPMDAAEILVTNTAVVGRALSEFHNSDISGLVAIHHIERGGVPVPLGLHLKLRRFDVLFVAGVKSGVERLAALAGRIRAAERLHRASRAFGGRRPRPPAWRRHYSAG